MIIIITCVILWLSHLHINLILSFVCLFVQPREQGSFLMSGNPAGCELLPGPQPHWCHRVCPFVEEGAAAAGCSHYRWADGWMSPLFVLCRAVCTAGKLNTIRTYKEPSAGELSLNAHRLRLVWLPVSTETVTKSRFIQLFCYLISAGRLELKTFTGWLRANWEGYTASLLHSTM